MVNSADICFQRVKRLDNEGSSEAVRFLLVFCAAISDPTPPGPVSKVLVKAELVDLSHDGTSASWKLTMV